MRIRKIELIGFKSFKDRTVIHFDAGITGIVGPNGCGKSNIVDALLWVMGEMSAKDLRGSTMMDVIFAGAEDYAPSGMAEVSLTLENDGGPFPAQYLKHSEIMVTRRLHRNGESEYLINKEPSRLKDVQEIFMDTGAGSKGFSIIQQGMIGKIIQSKPEERRMLIEEAAGITKFKARKRESQRKLESTDQNLIRLQDIVGELKRQIESLQRQAQRAERYKQLKGRAEELDLWISSLQFFELRELANQAQAIFVSCQDADLQSAQELSSLASELETQKLKLLEIEKELTERQTSLAQEQSAAQAQELEMQSLKFELEKARTQEQMNSGLATEQRARLELLQRDLESTEIKKSQVEKEKMYFEEQFGQRKELFEEVQSKIEEMDQELTHARRDAIAFGQNESSLLGQLKGLSSQLEDLSDREQNEQQVFVELQQRQQEFEGRKKRIYGDLEKERQLQLAFMSDAEVFEANKKSLQNQISEKRIEVDQFKDSLNQVASRLYGLENLKANFEGFSEGVRNVMLWQKTKEVHADGSVSEGQSYQPLSDIVEVDSGYEVAFEAALGSKLQTLITESSDKSLAAIDYLKQCKLGRSSFVTTFSNDSEFEVVADDGVIGPLVDHVKAPELHLQTAKALIGRVLIVDSVRTALRLRSQPNGSVWSYVTPDGDVLSQDGVLTGGAPESADSGVMKRKAEIKELSQQKDEWSGKLALATAQLKKLEDQLSTVTSDYESALNKKLNQEIKVAELKKDFERAENELANSQAILSKQERETVKLGQQLIELREKSDSLEKAVQKLNAQKMEAEGLAAQLTDDLTSSRMGFDQMQEEVTELQIQVASKNQEFQGLQNQHRILSQSVRDLEDQLSRIQGESAKNTVVLDEGQLKMERARLNFDEQVSKVETLKLELARLRNQFEVDVSQVREIEKNHSEKLRLLTDNNLKMNEAQFKLEQARMKEQHLLEQVREKYMLDLVSVYQEKMQREGLREEGEKELQDLREKLSKIGDVNLAAIEEYKENSQRYEFLVQQQQDLNEAKDQLRKVIERINKICHKRFRETFDLVNERFQKVFPVLFGGGEARLNLVEDEEKGEVGIDIVAKPPGKKMQNISLLSGGEKALTAVSLVFSIFLVKPSPYCLLDEVDAPLDDANVFRFNELVREMSKRSQIIVVTHNKHTMDVVGKLYGVTMQEKGVSTMVSVNLNAAAN